MEVKWFAIMMIGIFATIPIGGAVASCQSTRKYEACVAHHTPAECEKVK